MHNARRRAVLAFWAASLLWCIGCQTAPSTVPAAPSLLAPDAFTLHGTRNFRTGYPARNAEGLAHAVIEIPAGQLDKWEVAEDGNLHWEMKQGKPRVVQYAGYPANYGMVPQTLEAKAEGGDGDPLDILVLGPPRPRGSVMAVRVIGALRMLDGGEEDSKLIGVDPDGPFKDVVSIAELDQQFPGVSLIVDTWFRHYKGPGKIQTRGYEGPTEAQARLDHAIEAYRQYGP